MTGREPAQNIDDDAAAWAARTDRGLSEAERQELDAWLAQDSRRVGAFARARAIWLHAERAIPMAPLISEPQSDRDNAAQPAGRLSRRAALFGGGALAAGLAAAFALPSLTHRATMLRSGIGEIRRVPLGDGSVATLDTDSILEIAFTQAARWVRLRRGGAFFEVAADLARPFLVEAGEMVLRATASTFAVRAFADLPLMVLVSSGRVWLEPRDQAQPPVDIMAGSRATIRPDGQNGATMIVRHVSPDDVDRSLSWRNGMLSFEGETLGEAAATFRRYGPPAIEISSPTLARKPITGLFTANDPAGFARAAALSLDARVERNGDVIILKP